MTGVEWAPHESYPPHVRLAQYVVRAEFHSRMGEDAEARSALRGATPLAHEVLREHCKKYKNSDLLRFVANEAERGATDVPVIWEDVAKALRAMADGMDAEAAR